MSLYESIKLHQNKIAVVGLGYVGLPLAVEFGKLYQTIGFDVNQNRVNGLIENKDVNSELTALDFKESRYVEFTYDETRLKEAKLIIIAVPTPITQNKQPDLSCLKVASEIVGRNLSQGSIVVYESTVYPGVTEDFCAPILENVSGLESGVDFHLGYSPERINPGDKEHSVTSILKIVSANEEAVLEDLANIYDSVIKAGIHKVKSIKCAEAAKVIENTQRDLNIALVNELAMIFDKIGIDTKEVLNAAGTKWNFIKMKPGLVGGHCIGVDPYYLTFKAAELGYHPQVILAGRRINDGMGKYIAEQTVKHLIRADKIVKKSKVLVMGITFKENVSDIRNSRVIDVIQELESYGVDVSVTDPYASKKEVREEYGIELIDYDPDKKYDAIVLTVNHDQFHEILTMNVLKSHLISDSQQGVLIDVKWLYEKDEVEKTGIIYWSL